MERVLKYLRLPITESKAIEVLAVLYFDFMFEVIIGDIESPLFFYLLLITLLAANIGIAYRAINKQKVRWILYFHENPGIFGIFLITLLLTLRQFDRVPINLEMTFFVICFFSFLAYYNFLYQYDKRKMKREVEFEITNREHVRILD